MSEACCGTVRLLNLILFIHIAGFPTRMMKGICSRSTCKFQLKLRKNTSLDLTLSSYFLRVRTVQNDQSTKGISATSSAVPPTNASGSDLAPVAKPPTSKWRTIGSTDDTSYSLSTLGPVLAPKVNPSVKPAPTPVSTAPAVTRELPFAVSLDKLKPKELDSKPGRHYRSRSRSRKRSRSRSRSVSRHRSRSRSRSPGTSPRYRRIRRNRSRSGSRRYTVLKTPQSGSGSAQVNVKIGSLFSDARFRGPDPALDPDLGIEAEVALQDVSEVGMGVIDSREATEVEEERIQGSFLQLSV